MRRGSRRARAPLAAALGVAWLGWTGCAGGPRPSRAAPPAVRPAWVDGAPEGALTLPLDPALLRPSPEPYRLGPGDRLEVELAADPASRTSVTVGPDGKIYYDLLPGLDVWGLTLPETRERLSRGLQAYVRGSPVIWLTLREAASQRVWILGRVSHPGIYPLERPTTLLEAIAEAGGLPAAGAAAPASASGPGTADGSGAAADLSRSFVIRQGHLIPVDFQRLLLDGDPSQNLCLRPGDFIFVPPAQAARVHVLGAVVQPQTEAMTGGCTLIQAIALAGGAAPGARLSSVAILRGPLTHPRVALVAVDAILHGRAPDLRLQAGDIVYVPNSPYTGLARYVDLILDTFVRTIGVNEGVYVVTGQSQPVGVGVNVSP